MYREELLDLLARHGIRCQVDHQGKYFPVTGQASDVLAALLHYDQKQGVQLMTDSTVQSIQRVQGPFEIKSNQGTVLAGAVIVTTGGMTYPVTGSAGDGYRLAASSATRSSHHGQLWYHLWLNKPTFMTGRFVVAGR